MPREEINLNIDVSVLVVHGREVKLSFPKCEVFIDVEQNEEDYSQELEPVRGFIEIEIRDKNGIVIREGRHKMHSFVNNVLRILEGWARAVGGMATGSGGLVRSTTVVNVAGSSVTAYIEWYDPAGNTRGGGNSMGLLAGDNVDSYGIVVGSGTSPVTLDSYALASKISHGTSEGQLDYDAMAAEELGLDTSVSPPVYRCRFLRGFKNLSGGDIVINEVALIARCYWKDYGAVRNDVTFMIARDVLPISYTVPAGGSATVVVVVEVVLG